MNREPSLDWEGKEAEGPSTHRRGQLRRSARQVAGQKRGNTALETSAGMRGLGYSEKQEGVDGSNKRDEK